MSIFIGLFLLAYFFRISSAVNVVVFLPGTTDDEKRIFNRLAQELAFRNHHVCVFRSIIIPEKKFLVQPRLQDVRELRLNANLSRETHERVSELGNDEAIWLAEYDSSDKRLIPIWTAHANACDSTLDSDLMDRLRDELYDVAVVYAGNPCYLGIVHALSMPFIYFDARGYTDEIVMASSQPWIPGLPLSSKTTDYKNFALSKRAEQLWNYVKEYSAFTNFQFLMQTLSLRWTVLDESTTEQFRVSKELKKRFPVFPNVNEIKQTAAAYFVNSDQLIELDGRPASPNLVYVGGMHVEFPRPMFPPFNETNALSKDGVVLFSMGTVANCTRMPTWMKRAFLKAFGKFPNHRIYWRIGSQTLDDVDPSEVPKNINFTQFIPQNDLLAADETVLLISNGGANSVMEALHYGVPILGIPLYGVNYDNLKKFESKGAAIILPKNNITAQSIYRAMKKLIKEEKYFLTAQRLSRAYKDRPVSALETAIQWVEYVGRHHGTRSKTLKGGNRLYFYQYLMLDVALVAMVCLYAFLKILVAIWNMCKHVLNAITRSSTPPNRATEKSNGDESDQRHDETSTAPTQRPNGEAGKSRRKKAIKVN